MKTEKFQMKKIRDKCNNRFQIRGYVNNSYYEV